MIKIKGSVASNKMAIAFAEDLGFKNLKVKVSTDNRIALSYESLNEDKITRKLGVGKPIADANILYKFGNDGTVVVKPKSKLLVLKNAATNSRDVRPIETHVPKKIELSPVVRITPTTIAPKQALPKENSPTETPNVPGSKENDDSKVPHIKLSESLVTMFGRAASNPNPIFRIRFMDLLWEYFNHQHFHNEMKLPIISLLKDVKSSSFRLRGQWTGAKRKLEIAPRLFNAHVGFFAEIFLHEMCHQAVTEIDKSYDRTAAGHGPNWQHWMIRVGLNPRRFDPNDNSTYMNSSEKSAHDFQKATEEDRKKQLKQEMEDLHMTNVYPVANMQATAQVVSGFVGGILICPSTRDGMYWAFLAEDSLSNGRYYSKLHRKFIYNYIGTESPAMYNSPAWQTKISNIRLMYKSKR